MSQVSLDRAIQLAYQLHQAGRLTEAEKIYRGILAQHPAHGDALRLLGALAGQMGQWQSAVDFLRQAIRLRPEDSESFFNLGLALMQGGQFDEAASACRQAIRLRPDFADAHNNLGIALKELGKFDEAIIAYRRAIRLNPDFAAAHSNLGIALNKLRRLDEAIAAHREAIRLKPDFAEAHTNLGVALNELGQLDEALAAHREAIRLKPGFADAHYNLGLAFEGTDRVDDAVAEFRQAMKIQPNHAAAHDNLLFMLPYHPSSDAQDLLAESSAWNARFAEPLKSLIRPHHNDRDPGRRLRIGYVSPDLRDHPAGRYLLPLLAAHDRDAFEIFAYSNHLFSDEITEKLKSHCDGWRTTLGVSDERVAAMMREDRIDILIDLAVHSSGNRLLVFARKPAPVQVTWLGYPGTTGLDAMDYRFTDPHLDLPGVDDAFYSEKSVRLPHTFWCYDPISIDPPVNSLPSAERGFITFGCLNRFCKINDGVLSLWAEILKSVSDSHLLLLTPQGDSRRRVLERLDRDGIGAERVEFVAKQPRLEYLRTYHRMDIALDTFPYAGGTITCDASWMGVPTITLRGRTAVGRGGASILSNLGLTDLIANTPREYARIAVDVALDLPRLAELRRTLRARMQASPLMDAPRFARHVEAAYRRMWRDWCGKSSTR